MGFILSTYQIASLIISPIVGWKMNDFGRKNCIVGGFFLIILATIGFGTLAYVNPDD
jgi:MFS family permease